jgi:hypothetical protein
MIEELLSNWNVGQAIQAGLVGLVLVTVALELRITYRARKLGAIAPQVSAWLPLGTSPFASMSPSEIDN